eukprot:g2457.t1
MEKRIQDAFAKAKLEFVFDDGLSKPLTKDDSIQVLDKLMKKVLHIVKSGKVVHVKSLGQGVILDEPGMATNNTHGREEMTHKNSRVDHNSSSIPVKREIESSQDEQQQRSKKTGSPATIDKTFRSNPATSPLPEVLVNQKNKNKLVRPRSSSSVSRLYQNIFVQAKEFEEQFKLGRQSDPMQRIEYHRNGNTRVRKTTSSKTAQSRAKSAGPYRSSSVPSLASHAPTAINRANGTDRTEPTQSSRALLKFNVDYASDRFSTRLQQTQIRLNRLQQRQRPHSSPGHSERDRTTTTQKTRGKRNIKKKKRTRYRSS